MTTIMTCGRNDYETLAGIWERSVRATHWFLSENDIEEIRAALVPHYFPNVDLYAVCHNRVPAGFVGLAAGKIEMLFVDSSLRGRGYGSMLVDFAVRNGATLVDVNEQNRDALQFYLAKGFAVTGRDATDDCGRPFPILHMSL